ncbi:MAG: 30S ribosomal protein S2 [Planctomycetes bacterium]|nr:30S ribosomal protein S2 [Planctomycetota bacterium]
MASELAKELIQAGIHFGHRASRWNPKMKPYIFGKRNLIHIVDIKETLRGLLLAKKYVAETVASGKDIIIVGTKRQARKAVREQAEEIGMHWVTDRWLGGTLTNFREIRKRVGRLEELEQLEADNMLDAYSKKEGSSLRREMRKINRNLGGIRRMKTLPGAMVVIDQRREIIAVREANKLHIPVICLIDTDSDPDVVDIPIPGNDDAMRGINIIVREICAAVTEGLNARVNRAEEAEASKARKRDERHVTARAYGASTKSSETSAPIKSPTPDSESAPADALQSPTEATPARILETPAPAEQSSEGPQTEPPQA